MSCTILIEGIAQLYSKATNTENPVQLKLECAQSLSWSLFFFETQICELEVEGYAHHNDANSW